MKLKGLVWFFAIMLILISVYQLSFTWVVNAHENKMKAKAVKFVSQSHPGIAGDEKDVLVQKTFNHYLDSTRDDKIYPVLGTTYQKSKENELSLPVTPFMDQNKIIIAKEQINFITGMYGFLSDD